MYARIENWSCTLWGMGTSCECSEKLSRIQGYIYDDKILEDGQYIITDIIKCLNSTFVETINGKKFFLGKKSNA